MSKKTGDQRLRQELVEQARMSVEYWRERNALRTELDEVRTELAGLKAREHVLQPALKAALNNSHDEIERLRKELAEVRKVLAFSDETCTKYREYATTAIAESAGLRQELAELKSSVDELEDSLYEQPDTFANTRAMLTAVAAELGTLRQELAGLKAERAYDAAPAALADTPARRDKRALHNAAYGAPAALAGDALREALAEAIDRALVGDPAEVPTEDIVAAVMPIVGRAALAARDAFQAPPVHVPPLPTGLVYRMKAPERELRVFRVTTHAGTVTRRAQCSVCSWAMSIRTDQGNVVAAFDHHDCRNYPLATDTEKEEQ